MTNIFLKINEHLTARRPFAIYSKPGSSMLTGVFQADGMAYTLTGFEEPGFVMAPFAGGDTVFIPYSKADVIVADISNNGFIPAKSIAVAIDEAAKESFEALVRQCINAITTGNFEKIVASRTETVPTHSNITDVYHRLLLTYPDAFRYCFYSPATGVWMGATPEQLLKAEGKTVHTVALAGTQLYKEGETAVWQAKEQQEQQFVTDYILQELDGLTTAITTTAPYTFRAGNIVHIKTDISAQLIDGASLQKVIEKLHPTPAVCGLPKKEALEFLLQHEGYNREYYAGYLGELNHDFATGEPKTDLFVNLRSMKMGQGNAQLFIGCGITKDSDPEKEFLETVNKSMTMRKVLAP